WGGAAVAGEGTARIAGVAVRTPASTAHSPLNVLRRIKGGWENTCRRRICTLDPMSRIGALLPAPRGIYSCVALGGRPMAGHQVLVLRIGVRVPAPQLRGRRERIPSAA